MWNFPYVAIEEAAVNAEYHRSYEEREPIEVRIGRDELVVLSFPGPDRSIRLADFAAGRAVNRRYRNRRIGEFLKELDLTEGRSTGISKILKAMAANGSPAPLFETDDDRLSCVIRLPVHPLARGPEGSTPEVTDQVTVEVDRLMADRPPTGRSAHPASAPAQPYVARSQRGRPVPAVQGTGRCQRTDRRVRPGEERYYARKTLYPQDDVARDRMNAQQQLVAGMLTPVNLLQILRTSSVFMDTDGGIASRWYVGTSSSAPPTRSLRTGGSALERSGVVWHTQGFGKSLTMVFLARMLRANRDLSDYKIVLVNDRQDLEVQLGATVKLIGGRVNVIASRQSLRRHLATVRGAELDL